MSAAPAKEGWQSQPDEERALLQQLTESKPGLVSFQVKMVIMCGCILFYPVLLCVMLSLDPVVAYWQGTALIWVAIVVCLWLVWCYIALSIRKMKREHAVVWMVVLPATLLLVACQTQQFQIQAKAVGLASTDCSALPGKEHLQSAWLGARAIYGNCTQGLATLTGAPLNETALFTSLRECPGYQEGLQTYQHQWRYLARMEREHHCGGWCTPSVPIWDSRDADASILRDRCSLAAGREIGGWVRYGGVQVLVESFIAVIVVIAIALFCPSIFGAEASQELAPPLKSNPALPPWMQDGAPPASMAASQLPQPCPAAYRPMGFSGVYGAVPATMLPSSSRPPSFNPGVPASGAAWGSGAAMPFASYGTTKQNQNWTPQSFMPVPASSASLLSTAP